MTLRLVLLDLDDTLVDHRGAVADGITAHLVARGLLDAADAAERDRAVALWVALEEEHYHRYLAGELDYTGQRRARARGFLAAWGSGDAADLAATLADDDAATDAWFGGYLTGYEASWRALPGAVAALDEIARRHPGLRFGVVTNGERSQQEPKIQAAGLTDRLSPVVCSGDLGFTKPDPRIFLLACRQAGADPADAVMVGDRLRTDAVGAVDAGLAGGVWFDALGDGDAPPPADVVRITALAGLADAVDRVGVR
ncbi:HAD family hydrolase [Clavibacter michiganensis]|uniref:Haloacid dehalogenase n=2 Tax=Clavibacter michiganensis subsp. insidiosus TaxID=33014 RepID=A0A0D5CK74_9MICO|nr:HAD-IA family hydrolase [Clavibacter michiganensis]AJW79660.1 haloacid dehalogenase [Clavibacter michiganensis subsp. insidiosus]AWF97557.1 haloacid dehalogenase [Clavibacter michiganensis subsp. insidiosus]AWG00736.1 haloacid dehalogenase [Clavibacter michiganensis subsp. insidiosus]OQJ60669.1 haloacid dehalogenase [Clavibacter michiganensis subsp. insidiosus]RII85963.1 HAD family hydrolase [Clavibacter michiganensis subsp. insidiosus]